MGVQGDCCVEIDPDQRGEGMPSVPAADAGGRDQRQLGEEVALSRLPIVVEFCG